MVFSWGSHRLWFRATFDQQMRCFWASLLIHSTCGVVVKSVHSHFPWLQLFTRLWRQAALRSMLTCHADFIFNSPSSLVNVKYCAPLKGVWVPRRQGSLLLSCTFCHFAKQFSFVSSAVMAADSSVSPARGSSTGGLRQLLFDLTLISEKKLNCSRKVNQMANCTTVQKFGLRKICWFHFTIRFHLFFVNNYLI